MFCGQNGRRYVDGIFSDSEICQHTFKIQEWFIAISTEIYMAYIPRLKPRWAYFPKYNQIELHNIDLFGTTG